MTVDPELDYLRREWKRLGPFGAKSNELTQTTRRYCQKQRKKNVSIDDIAQQIRRSCAFVAVLLGEYHTVTDHCPIARNNNGTDRQLPAGNGINGKNAEEPS